MIDSVPAYDDVGRGPAVILLHGFPFNRSMWRSQTEFLAPHGYRVVAPDLRGLGSAVQISGNDSGNRLESAPFIATMGQMAGDVVALMNGLNIQRAVFCGLSMGGYLALDFVSRFRERVAALILAGARATAADEAEIGRAHV